MSGMSSRFPRSLLLLPVFLVLVVGIGFLIGMSTPPDAWYSALEKPFFNPPNWVFGPVWSVVYVLIALAGWQVFRKRGWGLEMGLWLLQMGLNFVWSPIWFGLHAPWAAFAVISALWIVIVAFIIRTWRRERLAAVLFLPYVAWVSFALVLNGTIAVLN